MPDPLVCTSPLRLLALKYTLPLLLNMRRKGWIAASILATALLTPNHAYADAIYSVQVVAAVNLGPITSTNGNIYGVGSSTVQVNSGTIPAFGTYPDLANAGATATAGPNDLGVQSGASATANGVVVLTSPYSGYDELAIEGSATGIAELNDTLQLSNAPTTGVLDVYVQLDGSLLVSSLNNAFPLASIDLVGTTDFAGRPGSGTCVYLRNDSALPSDCGLLHDGVNLLELPYVLQVGNTVPFDLSMIASSDCTAIYEGAVTGSCLADTLFLDTAQVSSIVVADSNGNPVEGAYATSLSGVDYSLPAKTGAAPEPSTITLLGTGLLGVGGAFRRKILRA